jgi:hypothetical protein
MSFLRALLCTALLLATTQASWAQDAFVLQRDAEAERNKGHDFSISFVGGQRVFHVGETIPLRFTFTRNDVTPWNYEHCKQLGLAEAVLDHSEGTADPQADLWNNGVIDWSYGGYDLQCSILSGVVGGVPAGARKGPPPPIQFTVYLNQGVRFDRPGHYRFYVRSRHNIFERVGEARTVRQYMEIERRRPRMISNVLEIDILERDQAWEAQVLADALSLVDRPGHDPEQERAAHTIAYLGSPAAIREMAARFEGTERRVEGTWDWSQYFLRGLFGAADRGLVVAELERQLDRDDRYVSPRFVDTLAVLELSRRSTSRPLSDSEYRDAGRAYGQRHYAALKRAGRLQARLAEDLPDVERRSLAPALADFPADVEAALAGMAPKAQRELLTTSRGWTFFLDPAFVPMLTRLVDLSEPEGPQAIALRLMFALDPARAREIAMRELRKTGSVVDVGGLELLPDEELPELDEHLATTLEHATGPEEYQRAIDRVQRFATGGIARRVKAVYRRMHAERDCATASANLAYFFRVDPAYARSALPQAMRTVSGDCNGRGVLPAIAARFMSPDVEDATLSLLAHMDGWAAADALRMLQRYGSPRASAPIWRAFRRWNARWRDRKEELSSLETHSWDASLEYLFPMALRSSSAWRLDDRDLARMRALCVTENCVLVSDARDPSESPEIGVVPPARPLEEPAFWIADRTNGLARSPEALRQWMGLFPRGTRFGWSSRRSRSSLDSPLRPTEEARYFESVRALAEATGMSLERDLP